MYDRASFYYLLLTILLLFLAGAVYMDLRSRRGWGLALVALALSCYGVWLANFVLLLQDAPSIGNGLASGLVLAVYLAIYLGLTLIVWISALVEAGVSRQWRWFSGLFAAALMPTLFVLAIVTRTLGGPGFSLIGVGLFLIPPLTMLAYGVARIVRPAAARAA